jgi:hypothetical protein
LEAQSKTPRLIAKTPIVVEPNKNLENDLVRLIFSSGTLGLNQKKNNAIASEPAYWIYHTQNNLSHIFKNFKTNHHSILTSLLILDPLVKHAKNSLL